MKRNLLSYLTITLKGICMGAADVVPGVSGGTIAFITGIYQEFIDSIKSIDAKALGLLFKGRIKDFWKAINGTFLLSVFAGILISVFSLAKLMQYLMAESPIQLWSFFFGLILASSIYILRGTKGIKVTHIPAALLGVAIGATICLVAPANTPDTLWFIFLCGAIAICAMILPGISGSFILLLMGKYAYVLGAVSSFNILVLAVFAIGAVVGILSFSHLLSWLLKKFYNGTVMFLCGLMLGSLIKVWPWKVTLESGIDHPILPSQCSDPHIAHAVIAMIAGCAIIFIVEFASSKLKHRNPKM